MINIISLFLFIGVQTSWAQAPENAPPPATESAPAAAPSTPAAEAAPATTPAAEKPKKATKPKVAKGKGKSMKTTVVVETSLGNFEIQLNGDKSPKSTENFLKYVDDKFYDGTIFHRVIKGFMIQGGGFITDMTQKKTREPIKNEAKTGGPNKRGTIAMARTQVPDSATSQFFINTVDNGPLDYRDDSPRGIGYAVFGEVTSGMDVVDKIESVATTRRAGHDDVPSEPVIIKSIKRK